MIKIPKETDKLTADFILKSGLVNDEQLKQAINSLDEHQRICIELFYLHNKRYTAIAELTDYSILQVKSYIQNGKRNLKNYLINNNERARNTK